MDCEHCEDGECGWCTGITMEGFNCECYDCGHYGNPDVDDLYDYDDECDVGLGL